LKVTGGLSVSSLGAKVTGGVSVSSGGFGVVGGMTITGNTNSAVMSVTGGGMTVGGAATVTGSLFADSFSAPASDSRLKRDVVALQDSLNKISQLNGLYFSWINNETNGIKFSPRRQIGVIAQEVENLFPEAVSDIFNRQYLGVRYSDLVPVLVESIKELEGLVNELQITTDYLVAEFEGAFASPDVINRADPK
jgi:hypothetical protein